MTDNSKIGGEFEQNKLSEVCTIDYLGVVSQICQICHENINKPLDGAYLADFGIDISLDVHTWPFLAAQTLGRRTKTQTLFGLKAPLIRCAARSITTKADCTHHLNGKRL